MQDMINNLSIAEKIELYNCLYEDLAGKGIEGDTQLAHVNVEEMAVLRAMGGSGTINPHTNLIQFGGGGSPPPPPPATSTVTQQATNPDELKPFVTDVLEKAQAIQERREEEGYIPFSGPRIAQFAPEQTQAFEQIKGLVGQGQQYFDPAARLTASSAFAPTGPQVGQFMNPYIQNVVDIQQREARRAADIDRQQLGAQAVGAGAFGGSRQAILEAEQSRNLQQQLGDIQARGLAAAYEDAQTRLQQQRERERLAGAQFASLGQAVPGQAFRELSALEAIGAQRQQQAQQALDIAQQEYEIARTFPERTLQDYQSIIRGYAAPIPASTVQRSQVTKPAPSFLQQAAGLGLATAGVGKAFGGFKEGGLVSLANGGIVKLAEGKRARTAPDDFNMSDNVKILYNMTEEEFRNPDNIKRFGILDIQEALKQRRLRKAFPPPEKSLRAGLQQRVLPTKGAFGVGYDVQEPEGALAKRILNVLGATDSNLLKVDPEVARRQLTVSDIGGGPPLPKEKSPLSQDVSRQVESFKKMVGPLGQPLSKLGQLKGSAVEQAGQYLFGTTEGLAANQAQIDKLARQLTADTRYAAGKDRDDLMSDTFIKRGLTDVPQAGPMKGQVTDEERFRRFNKPEDLAAEQFARERFARINKEDSVIEAGVDDEARKRIQAGSATPIEIEQLKQINEEAAAERMRAQAAAGPDIGSVTKGTSTATELREDMLPDSKGRSDVFPKPTEAGRQVLAKEAEFATEMDALPDAEKVATQVNEAAKGAGDLAAATGSDISGLAANVKKDIAAGNSNSANVQFMNELSDIKSRLSDSYGKEREALMKQLETKDRGTGLALIDLGGAILAQDGGQTLMQVLGKGLKDSKFTTKIANLDDRQKKLALGIARLDRQELQAEFNLTKAQADAVLASRKLDIQSRLADNEEQKAEIARRKNLMTFTSKFGTIDLNKEVGLSRAKELFKDSFTDEGGFTPKMKEVLKNKGYASERGTIFNNELDDILNNKAKMQVFANTFNRYIIAGYDPNLALQGAQISLINNLPTKSTKPKK